MFRFIIVNDRVPFEMPHCACCTEKLSDGYLREFGTGLFYCAEPQCFNFSVNMAFAAMEEYARRVN